MAPSRPKRSPEGFVLAAGGCAGTVSSRVLAGDLGDGGVLHGGDDVLLESGEQGEEGHSWLGRSPVGPPQPPAPSPPPGPAAGAASGARRDTRPRAARAAPPTSSAGHRHLPGGKKIISSGAKAALALQKLGASPPNLSPQPPARCARWDEGTFGVQLGERPQDAFLLVGSGCSPGSVLLLLQQVLLGPALRVVLPQGRDLRGQAGGTLSTGLAAPPATGEGG